MRKETEAAIRAAATAQRIADSREGADRVTVKEDIDIVTAADVACEDAVRSALLAAFPGIAVIGEERGGEIPADAPYWLVDPICGTRCYASNVPLYCTNIALVEDGRVTAAVVALGRSGEIVYAERGGGTRLRTAEGADLPVRAGESSHTVWVGGQRGDMPNVMHRILTDDRWYVWSFSSTVAYPYLALGRIAGLVHFAYGPAMSEPPVHTAAGCLVAEEAGALVTDLATGGPWSLATRSFVAAATPALHADLARLAGAQRGSGFQPRSSP